jgi:hypothetical protein
VKISKTGGQFRDRFNADTDAVLADAFAFVAAIFLKQQFDLFVCKCGHDDSP